MGSSPDLRLNCSVLECNQAVHGKNAGTIGLYSKAKDAQIQANEASIGSILSKLLQLACSQGLPSRDLVAEFDNALHLASAINAAFSNSQSVRPLILSSVSNKTLQPLLRQFASRRVSPGAMHPHGEVVCPAEYINLQIRLHQKLGFLLLSPMLCGGACGGDLGSILNTLLEKQTALSSFTTGCMAPITSKPGAQTDKLCLFEAESTPQIASISHGWRDALKREISRDATCRNESITRMIGEIFRDLESRCNEAERPLRDEQSRSSDLQSRLENTEKRAAEFESQLHARMVDSETMVTQIEDQTKANDKRLREIQTELDHTCQNLKRAISDTERAKTSARDRDLEHLAVIAGKDDAFEEQTEKLVGSELRIADQDVEIARLQAQVLQNLKSISDNNVVIGDLNSAVAAANNMATSRQRDIDRLTESEKTLNASTVELAANLEEVSHRGELLNSQLNEELRVAKNKTLELQQRYNDFVSEQEAALSHLEKHHRLASQKWQTDLDEARQSALADEEQSASKNDDLKREVKKLRTELEQRDTKLAKAQRHLDRFNAVHMEVAKDRISTETTPLKHRQRRYFLSEVEGPIRQDSSELVHSAFDSSVSTRSGPTPKRTKLHQSSQTPTKSPTKSSRHSNATKTNRRSSTRVRRSPLTELHSTQNHAHLAPPRKYTKDNLIASHDNTGVEHRENDTIREPDSDEEFFDGSGIITSTDHQLLSASRKRLPRNDYNDTTMDETLQEVDVHATVDTLRR